MKLTFNITDKTLYTMLFIMFVLGCMGFIWGFKTGLEVGAKLVPEYSLEDTTSDDQPIFINTLNK